MEAPHTKGDIQWTDSSSATGGLSPFAGCSLYSSAWWPCSGRASRWGRWLICFGAFALVGGLFAVVVALGDWKMHTRWSVLLLEGLAGIAVGLLTFFWPLVTALILLYLIVTWALVTGVLELTVAVWMHQAVGNAWTLLLSGIASLVFGVLLVMLPGASLLALTWLIGIYVLLFGSLLVSLGLQWRWLERGVVRM